MSAALWREVSGRRARAAGLRTLFRLALHRGWFSMMLSRTGRHAPVMHAGESQRRQHGREWDCVRRTEREQDPGGLYEQSAPYAWAKPTQGQSKPHQDNAHGGVPAVICVEDASHPWTAWPARGRVTLSGKRTYPDVPCEAARRPISVPPEEDISDKQETAYPCTKQLLTACHFRQDTQRQSQYGGWTVRCRL